MKKVKNKVIISFFIISTVHIIINQEINLNFIFLILIIGFLYIKLYSKYKIQDSYRQLEILIPLINNLVIDKRLPSTRGYAASPDFLYTIVDIIKKNQPKIIVEAGSGISTIISAYAFKKYGGKHIISFDHEKKYADLTKKEIKYHNLEKFANVLFTPLINYQNGLAWYDISQVDNIKNIDLLIIDGPPTKGSKDARYPAIPLLIEKINIGGIVILDDGKRKPEKLIVERWMKEFDCFKCQYIENDKGAYILERIK